MLTNAAANEPAARPHERCRVANGALVAFERFTRIFEAKNGRDEVEGCRKWRRRLTIVMNAAHNAGRVHVDVKYGAQLATRRRLHFAGRLVARLDAGDPLANFAPIKVAFALRPIC